MGGKGIRRREKNYKAAHGGNSRLPPPPNPSSIDALPSKLRKIMSIAGAVKHADNRVKEKRGSDDDKEALSSVASDSMVTGAKRKRDNQSSISNLEHNDEVPKMINLEKKKKKKRKGHNTKAEDLRFDTVPESGAAVSQRKERKKKRLEERKKKRKNDPVKDEGFCKHEEIKFGDIVQAPPKLTAVPKVFKTTHDASQERIRLKAVEAYRKRKGWESRPGIQLPPLVTSSPLL